MAPQKSRASMPARPRNDGLKPCTLCKRTLKAGTTEHHLIPRKCHSNRWFRKRFTREQMRETVPVCRDCHKAIHKLIPCEKELGRHFNTVESLLANEEIARFVDWAQRQK
ncbi:MAG: hypothetical protein AAF456_14065 [Planctomycetota bacterium]